MKKYFYLITIVFFVLGFFNIMFAWFGFICMALPFILLARDGKKTWCQNYCPRANLFTTLFKKMSLTGKAGPAWLVRGKAKWFVFTYFIFNLFVMIMSTIMVVRDRVIPMTNVRFLLALKLPWDMPQVLNIGVFPDWMVHLSFRMYSMMLTTTILGMILAFLYKPRTWCTVCPINTASDMVLHKKRNGVE